MQVSRSLFPGPARGLVLGVAFAIGLGVAVLPHADFARAADAPGSPKATATTPDAKAAAAPSAAAPAPAPDAKSPNPDAPDTDDADTSDDDAKGDVSIGSHGIVIQKGGKRIRVEGLGRDHEYDSFQQFVEDAPWLAGAFFLVVTLVFLIPLLIIVLLIWYKIRKNRMANETMLKLAERGIVPPAAAMEAVASGTTASVAAAATAPTSTPAYEQARFLHRRTVWSDLRKGVILTAVGLGLSFFSILDDGTPNSVGLIVLFIGLGYCLLWFFEDRSGTPGNKTGAPPPGGA